MQGGMLFHALQNEDSRAYFEQITFRIKGDIDRDLLQQSFDIIVARYDILRTVFRADKLEEPLQFVLKERNFKLHVEDISHLSETGKNTYLQEFVDKDKEKGFDLTRDILMRATLVKMGANAYALVWSFHHILMDGWCLGIIYKELTRVYRSLKAGIPPELEPVTPYVNYINWLKKQDKEKGLEYWGNYLEGFEQQTTLPRLKPADGLYRLEEYDVVIAGNEARALDATARQNRVTVNSVFQTLWGILLQKYNNRNDVVFGAVVSGRPPEIEGIEKMVGLFLNTVPVRIKNRPEDSVVQLLKKVQEETALSKNFEYLLLADIQSRTALKGSPIDHIMAFENLPVQEEVKNAGMGGEPGLDGQFGIQDIKQYNQTNYDFNVIIIPQAPLVVRFNYNSRIYENEFVKRVGLHLKEVIKRVLDNPDTAVKEIEIITEEERQQVLFDFNRTAADYPADKTIHELFNQQVETTPDGAAVVGKKERNGEMVQITYGELNQRSDQLAHLLRERGVLADNIIGIMMERSVEMIIGILGILKAGGAYLPIDPDYPQERIDYMLKDSGAKILLTGLPEGPKLHHSSFIIHHCNNLAYVIYTSGTTGKPKGVIIHHGNVVRLMVNDRFQFDFNDRDVWTLFHSFCFDFSVWEMYGALLYGGKLIIIPKMAARDTGKYLEILKKQQVTVLNQTPSAFYALLNLGLRNPGKDLNFRYVIFGGEALSPGKLKEWKTTYPETKLINMYGITETTVHVTFKEIRDPEIESGVSNIGKPIPTLTIYIMDRCQNLQPIGTAGELCVGGDGVGRGYLNRPELTAEKFVSFFYRSYKSYRTYIPSKRIYKSGDLVRWLPGGELEYLGRIDHQVKIRGFRIEPGEIESRLSGYEGIEEAVVISKEDEKGDKYLCAYFVAGDEVSIPGLREYLPGYLPEYMVPSYFIRLEKIPLTPNGKLDRKALPGPGFKSGEDYTAPRNEVEKKLVEIWSEVLGIEKEIIGIDRSFFELGGHSLKATILISRIHKVLDVQIPLAEVFIKPSIRELSRYIEAGETGTYFSIEAVEDKEYYPVSSAQKRLYLLKTMTPESTAYNSYAVFTLEGGLETFMIEETFRKLIHGHESLRTSFHMIDGEPVQRVHKEVDFGIEYRDLAAKAIDSAVKRANESEGGSLIPDFIRPFDLANVPLLRVGLVKTSSDEHIFIVDMHHIVTDGTSMGLLIDGFMALFRGEGLPGLRIQYKDYSQWQKSLMGSEIMKRQESYWLNRCAGEMPVLNLPTDFPRPAVYRFEGNALGFSPGKHEARQLKALALEEGGSLYMVLLAVINVFLAKVSGQERIVVGTPTAGRRHTDLEKIMGMFVNTLPLYNEPAGKKTFLEFLNELKQGTLEAFENQDYQFEDLVDNVVKERDTGRNPLFDVMFALQNMETPDIEIPGLKLKPYPAERRASLFDLSFQGIETGEGIHFTVEYCTALFKKETVQRLILHFHQVIVSILADRKQPISEIEIITAEERGQVLFDFNDTKSDYPRDKTIHELFAEQVERVPDRIAVTGPAYGVGPQVEGRFSGVDDLSLTYRELNERANRLCHRLRHKGVGLDMNPIVGIMMGRFVDIIVGIIGILKAGGAYLPIEPEYPEDRLKYMLAEGNVKVLVSELNKVSEGIDVVKPSELSEAPLTHPAHSTYSTHPCYVLYTSGSTGKPKGVIVEHRNAVRLVKNTNYIEFQEHDHILQAGAIEFDASTFEIWGPLLNGLGLYFIRKEDMFSPAKFKEVILKYDIAVMDLTTGLFSQLSGIDSGMFAGLRCLLVGGDVLPPDHTNKVKRMLPRLKIMNVYGPTENTTYSSTFLVDREYTENIPIGKPIANSTVFIVDKYDHLNPVGVVGELYVGGDGVARGYLNNPELTAEKFPPVFYRSNKSYRTYSSSKLYKTGDLARWLPDGNIQFLGRIDHQVKIRGFRIELGEIENHLLQHEKIKETVVVARKGEDGNKYLCAYWLPALSTGDTGAGLTVSELKEFLSGKLAPYMIPSYFIRLKEMPLGSTGKIDRKLLPAPDISNIALDSVYEEPGDDMETLIADTWKEVLNLERVGVRDNFFDLGGNSLKIVQVNDKLSKALGVRMQVVNLFKYPTVTELKKYLLQLTGGAGVQVPGVGEETRVSGPGKGTPVNADIAVIGMAGRFPGAKNIRRFWENLADGIESISFFSSGELLEAGISSQLLDNPDYVKARAIVEDKDQFDAAFFNYTPREAGVMDPQMRMFHECVWEALEDAGCNPETYDKPIGLYAGASANIIWELQVGLFEQDRVMDIFESHQLTDSHFIPTRISYRLNLKGPAVFVQTACSTSLTAVHTACNALLSGDCMMALAGGVNLSADKKSGYLYQEGLVLSPDGHCRAFDNGANGTVGGEGAAVVLLKPLGHAREDSDHIYAVIKAAAANNDGARKVGFSAPSIDGQAEAIAGVFRKAGVPPESITYIETHGTGTVLGDPIELEALKQAFHTQKKGFCALGSVKTNVGHMDAAAGAVSLIKTVLALTHRQIPPSLHFEVPNLQVDLVDSPFYVNTELTGWDGPYPRRAGVSSFGIGGTNVHVVLEEWRGEAGGREQEAGRPRLLLLSAKTRTALDKMRESLANYLKENPVNPGSVLADTAYTLQVGRKSFNHRWMAVCSTAAEAVAALAAPGGGETHECLAAEKNDVPLKVKPGGDEGALRQTGRLWLHGQEIDWQDFYAGEKPRRVSLPTYPFERERYWIEGNPFQGNDLPQVSRMSQPPQPVRKDDIADWFYFPRWTGSTLVPSPENMPGSLCFLMFINECSLVRQLVRQVRSVGIGQGHQVITVEQGDAFAKKGEHEFVIDSRSKDDYHRLFTGLKQMGRFPHRIVHSWNVTDNNDDCRPGSGTMGTGFYSLLYLSKAIGKQDFEGEIRIDVVTADTQEVTGNEILIPGKAVVLGPLKVIPQEYPYIVCRCIDIELPAQGSRQEEILAGCLADEFLLDLDSTDTDIAYRGHYRWIKTYEPVRLEAREAGQLRLRDRGVYLVTGGTGNIGFTLAEYLVKEFRARLVLTGAASLPPREEWGRWLTEHSLDTLDRISRKITNIRRLEAAGGEILVLTADVGDKEAMEGVIREAEKTFGPINGIIHAAGVTSAGSTLCPVEEVGEDELNQQFRPKIKGTLVLADLVKNKELDFCILTASLSPILGGLGFFAYSAANAFMDTFAHLANRSGSVRWISVDWADWGFAREIAGYSPSSLGASAVDMMISPDEGVETFKRILTLVHSPVSQVVVSAGDLQARIDQWVKLRSLRRNDSTGAAGEPSYQYQFRARPDLSAPYAAPRTPIEQTIADIWKHQFGFEKIGIRDDFFELGGDSLKAISMVSKIHKELSARVKLNEFFTRPTVETLARFITEGEESSYVSIPTVEKREYYALSSAQERLYVLDRMGTLGTSYNLSMVTLLQGGLDKESLEQTFKVLLERHESFRTSFEMPEMPGGEPVQRVHGEAEFEIEYYDLAAKNTKKGEEENLIRDFIRPFKLSRAPLLRVGLIESAGGRNILIVDMHHIIFDGVSQQILMGEFAALYGNKNRTLPPLRLQYKDYSGWQNSPQQREFIEKQETYWLEELSGEIPVLALPIDYPRPLVQDFAGGAVHSEFTAEETGALNEIARVQGTTLFMVLLAVYDIFLSKISGQEDIQVGTPIAGRPHTDLEPIVGMFVNTLVMRNRPSPAKTFCRFLEQVKEKTLQAFENQDCQFEDLVEKLEVPRDTGRNPLYDVVFVLQNIAPSAPETPVPGPGNNRDSGMNLKVAPLALEKTTSQFDLILEANEIGEKVYFLLQYCSKLFRKETIERFSGYFKKVAAAVIENPGIEISGIEIISEEEKKRLLVDFNDTAAEYPQDKTIHALFAEQAVRTPDGVALAGSRQSAVGSKKKNGETLQLTYNELNKKAGQVARLLQEKGVKPDTVVGIMSGRSLEMVIGILGILKAGGAYLAIDANYPQERIDYMLKDSNAEILLTAPDLSDRPLSMNAGGAHIHHPGTLAYLIYTSGTTGRPRGILVEHRSLVNLCAWHNRYHGITARDRAAQYAGTGFDASLLEIFPPLIKGAALHIIDDGIKLDIHRLARYYRKNHITIGFLPTQFCQQFMEGVSDVPSLRVLLTGGDKLNRFVRRSYRLCDNYGPAENTVVTTIFTVESHRDNIPIGKPITNVQVHIVNKDTLQLQPLGAAGELCVSGDGLSRGYLNQPELTAEKFCLRRPGGRFLKKLPPWTPRKNFLLERIPGDGGFFANGRIYKTGDLARWLEDGNIQFLGRIDMQVQIRGFRVEPAEIQGRLCSHPEVKDALVMANDYSPGDKYLCAYIVPGNMGQGAESTLKAYLSAALPDYMIPSYFVYLDEIPLTPNGKADRKALPVPETGISRDQLVYTAPRNPFERELAALWCEILSLPRVPGIDDNFFGLGGHSLKATILAAKVQKTFNVHLPLTEVFRTPTVRELARYINNAVKEKFISIEPVEKREYYSLSSAQKRLYILQQMEAESTVYNMPQVVSLNGDLLIDKDKLTRTFGRSIARHESLRTSFHMANDEQVQKIHREVEFEIEYLDLAAKNAKKREEKNLIQDFIRPFDLSTAPLLRVGLIHNILLVDMHHIISDGLSMQLLVKDFISLYRGEELPPLRIRYKDYAFWQQREMQQTAIKQQETYWLKEFAGDIPLLDLPADFSRPAVQRFEGSRIHSFLSESEVRRLKEVASAFDATLYMVLLGAVNLLLYSLTGNEDIIIGSAAAGRRHADLEPIIGMFVNTLALRNQPTSGKVLKGFLREVKEKTLQAFENQDYQFEELVGKVSVERDMGRNPIFDVVFTLQNLVERPGVLQQDTSPSGGDGEPVGDLHLNPISKFDLTIFAFEGVEGVGIEFEYSTALFKQQTIRRFIRYFKKVISGIVENPDIPIADMEIIPGEEKRAILVEFNRTHTDFPGDKTIRELFEEQAKRTPDHIAIVGAQHAVPLNGGVHLTYRELNRKSDRLAQVLREKGVGPDTIIGIMVERSLEMIIGILGILKSSGAYLPIDPDYPRERIDYMLQDSSAGILVSEGIEVVIPGEMSKEFPTHLNLAYVIYTSGTTGKPRGTLITHTNVIRVVRNTNYIDITEQDRILQLSNYAFDGSVFDIYGALLNGAVLVMINREDVLSTEKLSEVIKKNGITLFFVTTALFNTLIDLGIDCFDGVRKVLFGGENVSVEHSKRALEYMGMDRILHVYGPTETTVYATCYPINEIDEGAGTIPIGGPISNTAVYILNKHLKPVPTMVCGEIYIGGEGLSRGYLNQPELTAKKFIKLHHSPFMIHRLYRSGDLARRLPDGNIEFIGRIDHQVKIRGFRIEPGEIENRLCRLDTVNEAVVIDRVDQKGEKYLCAYIAAGENVDISHLREELSRSLPAYMIPAFFVPIEAIPLTANGKVDRKALPEPEAGKREFITAPRDRIETRLAEIWTEVLQVDTRPDIDTNFFEVGGHSLKAAVMTAKIHKSLDVKVPLAELFRAPTIRGLAGYIKTAVKDKWADIKPGEKREYYVLSSAQKRLYLLYRMDVNSIGYNMPFAVTLEGEMNGRQLERAFNRLIKRHESFRTSIEMPAGEPVQRIHDEVEFEIEYYDLAAKALYSAVKRAKEREEKDWLQDFIRPFDLANAPFLRVGLIKTGRQGHILMVDMHHIICDGVSMEVLVTEFAALYQDRELPGFRIQYKDYCQWVHHPGTKTAIEMQEAHWLAEFAGEIPVLNLPADFPRPPVYRFDGDRINFDIPGDQAAQLKSLASQHEVTPYMLLLSIYYILLAKICGQDDIVVGTPIAGRRHADLESIIGMFVNTLALRNYPRESKTFETLLKEVKERTVTAFESQEYPFEELVEKAGVSRDTGRNPLFDVMFSYRGIAAVPTGNRGTEIQVTPAPGQLKQKPYHLDINTAKFDITLTVTEEKNTLQFEMEYSTSLFKAETIRRFLNYFKNIVSSVVQEPGITISSIDFIPEQERHLILHTFNDTAAEYPGDKTIHELFNQQVARTLDGAALIGVEHSVGAAPRGRPGRDTAIHHLTYYELNQKSNQLAQVLREKGVGPDSIVGIMVERSIEMIIGILGILKAGGAYLPIDPEYPEERIDYMLKDSGAEILLTSSDLSNNQLSIVNYQLSMNSQPAASLAYIIYTSGTTGKPKGVIIDHRNVVRLMINDQFQFDFNHRDVWTMFHSVCFDFSVWEMYGALLYGGKLVVIPKMAARDTMRYLEILKKQKVTVLNQTPSAFYTLMNLELKNIANDLNLRYVIFGGEALNPGKLKEWKTKYPETKLINMYGITETTVHVTFKEIRDPEIESGVSNIGKPIPTLIIYIMDKCLNLQPMGTAGELYVGGAGVGRGYLNRPGLTAEKFDHDLWDFHDYRDEEKEKKRGISLKETMTTSNEKFLRGSRGQFLQKEPPGRRRQKIYKSGDLGRWLPGGELEYLGRIDHQVKIRGFRIELGEIENQILHHEYVKETVVVVREIESSDKYLCAYIVVDPGSTGVLAAGLKEYLSRSLPGYMIPSAFVQLEKIPLTPNGKIDRKALPEPQIRGTGEYEPPRNQTEEQLVGIYRELLAAEKVGVTDDFFALGGNSLKAIKLISRIHETFSIDISVVQVFKTPGIRDLASVLIENRFIDEKEETVILLNSAKPKKIFAFPPAVGYSIAYTELAPLLEDYGFYAFNYIEKEDENQMKIYLDAIREIQPEGPYILLGYSAGGKLCIKAAELLEKAGHVVSDIIILDTYIRVPRQTEQEKEKETAEFYDGIEKGIEYLGLQHMKQKIMDTVKNYLHYHDKLELPGKVNSLIHLIQAEDKKGKEGFVGWEDFTRNREIVYEGYGVHQEMLAPGFIEKNVEIIDKILVSYVPTG
jgi:amino acid adenylation domain-containing protein